MSATTTAPRTWTWTTRARSPSAIPGRRRIRVTDGRAALPAWRESGCGGGSSGDCPEAGEAYASWRTSSYSGGAGGDCPEVSDFCTACVPVRDGKNPHGPAVVFGAPAWTPFVTVVKGDRPA
ncbi:DUF397 domain-containing protein [Streptomyces sp. CLV115]|uniref:DUF397 domain-containing protein n=1 Tax=Streptomyces sp. CLV115 TaxID=3138502 RepID=UPI00313AFA26